jgi:peptidyl-prolyl cis-trans isomerase A (cyclophilin A)
VRESNREGVIAFATDGPNTRTTQVYVNMANNWRLDARGFAGFGKVVQGMDVLRKLYSGYGEGAPGGKGPDQEHIGKEGEAYLMREFPKLDRIVKARLIGSGDHHAR